MTDFTDPIPQTIDVFAGRQALISRLYQQILDPKHRYAIVYTGHEGMGKSRLLQYLNQVFDESILSIYLPLQANSLKDEESWLMTLLVAMNQLSEERNFSLSRLPKLANTDELPFRDWLRDVYFPEIFHIIRSHRRILWLFDNAEHLLNAPAGHLNYLHELLNQHNQLSIVLSIDTDLENTLNQMSPLVNIAFTERIPRLNLEETAELLRQYAPGMEDEAISNLYEATGGHPRLLSRYGKALAAIWYNTPNQQAIAQVKSQVYADSREEFRRIWLKLSRDERLSLTALASLIYDDPLRPVTVKALETWLVETDFPMDIVAINAALRGLDYRDIIQHQADGGIKLVTGLMQQWLLEHARLDDAPEKALGRVSPRLALTVILIIFVLIALLFLIPLPLLLPQNPIATATLSP